MQVKTDEAMWCKVLYVWYDKTRSQSYCEEG